MTEKLMAPGKISYGTIGGSMFAWRNLGGDVIERKSLDDMNYVESAYWTTIMNESGRGNINFRMSKESRNLFCNDRCQKPEH